MYTSKLQIITFYIAVIAAAALVLTTAITSCVRSSKIHAPETDMCVYLEALEPKPTYWYVHTDQGTFKLKDNIGYGVGVTEKEKINMARNLIKMIELDQQDNVYLTVRGDTSSSEIMPFVTNVSICR